MWDLDAERARLLDDLRGLVAGEVRCDPLFCGLYASDGSILAVDPLAVVRPLRVRDVGACVHYAAERRIPIIPRGTGTGCVGGAIGPGIVLDMSRFFRQVTTTRAGTVRVAAGVTLERLNQALRRANRYFPWDTPSGAVSTIGGLLSRAAFSPYRLRYGDIGRYVVSLQLVLADGSVVEVPNQPTSVFEAVCVGRGHSEWWTRLKHMLRQHAAEIAEEQATPLRRTTGYRLAKVLFQEEGREVTKQRMFCYQPGALGLGDEALWPQPTGQAGVSGKQPYGHHQSASGPGSNETSNEVGMVDSDLLLNPAQLFLGAEGTLGVIVEVELAPPEQPQAQGLVVFFFESLEEALRALPSTGVVEPLACVVVDHRHLSLCREFEPRLAAVVPREAQAAMVVEIEGSDSRQLRQVVDALRVAVQSKAKTLGPGVWALESWDRQLFAQLLQPVPAPLYRSRGGRPVPFVDDVAVPEAKLPEFLSETYRCLRHAELTATIFCSGGDGRVTIRPIVDLSDVRQREALLSAGEAIFDLVLRLGGSITAGGGWGLVRSPYLSRQFPHLARVFQGIKTTFDPLGILNPGKIVAEWSVDELREVIRGGGALREIRSILSAKASGQKHEAPSPTGRWATRPQFSHLVDILQPLHSAATACFACGGCRHQFAQGRMCPVYRFFPAEEASPRAKVNMLLTTLGSGGSLRAVASPRFREIADLCVQCHMCTIECPAAVDIPRLVLEMKGQHAAAAGLLFSDWILAHLDLIARWALKVPRLANWALRTRWTRWLMERMWGIAQGRRLPNVATESFMHRAARWGWTRPRKQRGPRVAYFADLYVSFFAPELGELFLRILEHNNVAFFVPEKQRHAGVPAITSGALDVVRRVVRRNTRVLANAVRSGYEVVCTEPAAVVALKREYPQIDGSADVRLVAEHVAEACEFLWGLHQQGKLQLDFRPIPLTVGYHQPCRSKALGIGRPGESLLRLIPGLQVVPLPDMCSGMAGVFGLKSSNYRASLRGGFPLIAVLREPQFQAGVTECSACKIQLEQGAGKVVFHPIELLACAYGFVELESLFRRHRTRPVREGSSIR